MIKKLLLAIILALFIVETQGLTSLHAFTNRPSKPPVGARIEPLHHINRNLVAWWLFNDGAGSTLNDITGKHHGTLTDFDGSDDWVGSSRGGALDFDGSNDHVLTNPIPGANFSSGNYTVSVWFNHFQASIEQLFIGVQLNASAGWMFGVRATDKLSWYTVTAWHDATTVLSPAANYWYHATVVGTPGNYIIYLNGVSDGSGVLTDPGSNNTVSIGAYYNSGADWGNFNGLIDNVRIWNRALSAEEVAELYRNPLVGLWQRPVKWYGVNAAPASFTPTVTWW